VDGTLVHADKICEQREGCSVRANCELTFNPQAAIRNPQSAIRNPKSAIRDPRSAIGKSTINPQSAVRDQK